MKFFICFALLAAGALRAADSDTTLTAPAQNWVLPLFSPTGYRSLTLRGDQARLTTKDRIDVTNIRVDIFTGDASSKVTTIVLSPQATYLPSQTIAAGSSGVRIIRASDNTEARGDRWTYDFAREKVSLHGNVRITFPQPLNDFLK